MNLKQQFRGDGVSGMNPLDAIDHGIDIAEDLHSGHINRVLAQASGGLCPEQPPGSDLQALDPG